MLTRLITGREVAYPFPKKFLITWVHEPKEDLLWVEKEFGQWQYREVLGGKYGRWIVLEYRTDHNRVAIHGTFEFDIRNKYHDLLSGNMHCRSSQIINLVLQNNCIVKYNDGVYFHHDDCIYGPGGLVIAQAFANQKDERGKWVKLSKDPYKRKQQELIWVTPLCPIEH